MVKESRVPRLTDVEGQGRDSPALNGSSVVKTRVQRQIRFATAEDNAKILTEIREIVRNQLARLKRDALSGTFDIKQASVLHKLVQSYAILDTHTDKEHRKYDFGQASTENLEALEIQARKLLESGTD